MNEADTLQLISTVGINFIFLILFLREQIKVAELQKEWQRYQEAVQTILLGMIPKPNPPTPLPRDTEPLYPISEGRKPAEPPK